MTTYTVTFGKLGDSYPVPDVTVTADDANEFARAVAEHAIPHLRPVLEQMGHPEYADCFFHRSLKDPAYGEFMWLDFQSGKGARFCPARITTETPKEGTYV